MGFDSSTAPVTQARLTWKCRFAHEHMGERLSILGENGHDEQYYFPFKKVVTSKLLGMQKGDVALAPRPTFRQYHGLLPGIFSSLNGLGVARGSMKMLAESGYTLNEDDAALKILKMQFFCVGICGTNYTYHEGNNVTSSEPHAIKRGFMLYTNFTDETHGFGDILEWRFPNDEERARCNMRGLDKDKQLPVLSKADVFKSRATADSVRRALGLNNVDGLKKSYLRRTQRELAPANAGTAAQNPYGGSWVEQSEVAEAFSDMTSVTGLQAIRLYQQRLLQTSTPAEKAVLQKLFNHEANQIEIIVGLKAEPANIATKYTLDTEQLRGIKKPNWPAKQIAYHRALLSMALGVGPSEFADASSSYSSRVLQKGGATLFFAKLQEEQSRASESIVGICTRACEPRGGKGDILVGGPSVM